MTLDVFQPAEKPNGAGILVMVSSGWGSSHSAINLGYVEHFTKRGYTVFAVIHSASPRFSLAEIIEDVKRATRFVRFNSTEYGISPDKIGATGMSSGAHLSLMLGVQSAAGDPSAKDKVDQKSSHANCVTCFFPPTDFNNFVGPNVNALDESVLKNYRKVIGEIPDNVEARDALGRSVSPIYSVSSTSAPTLIFHGDKDPYVLLHQSQSFANAMTKAGAEVKLVIKKGESHGWKNIGADIETCADWFDSHLLKNEK